MLRRTAAPRQHGRWCRPIVTRSEVCGTIVLIMNYLILVVARAVTYSGSSYYITAAQAASQIPGVYKVLVAPTMTMLVLVR